MDNRSQAFYLGGGPFHLWSTSHMSSDLPTRTWPVSHSYLIRDLNCRVPLTKIRRPLEMSAGIPHSRSEERESEVSIDQIQIRTHICRLVGTPSRSQ